MILHSRRAQYVLAFAAATLVGLYFATQFYVNFAPDEPMIWRRALAVNMTYYYLWAAFSPIVLWAARRYRMEGGAWRRSALVHILLSCVLTGRPDSGR